MFETFGLNLLAYRSRNGKVEFSERVSNSGNKRKNPLYFFFRGRKDDEEGEGGRIYHLLSGGKSPEQFIIFDHFKSFKKNITLIFQDFVFEFIQKNRVVIDLLW